ncbi:MAG: hypothetical protein ABIK09_01020 [Pseudomonadota bacterium]
MGGFVLAPRDVELVQEWYERGIPMGVVMRGVTEGIEAWRDHAVAGQRPPHRLSFYQKRLRTHIKVWTREEEATDLELSRPRQFLKARRAELELLLAAEERELEREIKEILRERLELLDARLAAESVAEGAAAYELLLLDEEILQIYHLRLTGDAGAPPEEQEDGLRERLRIPTLCYWST